MSQHQTQGSIAVVGGGYTGLTAAYELGKKGYHVVVFERAEQVGGLASGFSIEGAPLERAYHHLFRTDTDILSLAKELGIDGSIRWYKESRSILVKGKTYPFLGAVDLLRFSPLPFFDRIRMGVVALFLKLCSSPVPFLSHSAYTWMKMYAGSNVVDVLWKPLLHGKFFHYFDKVSMAWLWARIHNRANSTGRSGSELGYPDGGFEIFTKALIRSFEHLSVSISTGVSIDRIEQGERGVKVVMNGTEKVFDRVVVTTPSSVFVRLLPEGGVPSEYRAQLLSVQYLSAVVMVFSSSQDLGDAYWTSIADMEMPFLVFINHTKMIPSDVYAGAHVYYIGAYVPNDHPYMSLPDADIKEAWFTGVRTMFSAFDASKVRECHIFRFKDAQHIVDVHYEKRIPSFQTPISGVYLSNFSQVFPEDRGTNFAVRDGRRVAALVDASYKT